MIHTKFETIKKSFDISRQTLNQFIKDENNLITLFNMAEALAKSFSLGNKVLTCGNGGSNCEAVHIAEELTGRYRKDRKALPALALSEPAYLTCVGNDYGFDDIFSRGVEAFGKKGDILIALSTSGNSKNVINAVKTANSKGMDIFSFLGKTGGALKDKGTFEVLVKAETTDRIQEVHMICIHILIEATERILFPENYTT